MRTFIEALDKMQDVEAKAEVLARQSSKARRDLLVLKEAYALYCDDELENKTLARKSAFEKDPP